MATPKISIIVPVYNAERYLHRCVDSILVQSFTDFEVLLIDDGSPDKSGEICDEYAKTDFRVRVFHKENGGVSSARQCGIDNAIGEYTIHADPDDWVESNMLEELYAKAIEENADMVICDYYEEYSHKQIYKIENPINLQNKNVFRELLLQLHGSCWNKLVKRVCYEKYNIHFPLEMNLWEDEFVMLNLTLYPIKIAYLPKAFYHYDLYTNPNSIVRKPSIRDLNSMKYLINFLDNIPDANEYMDELYKKKSEAKSLAFRLGVTYAEFLELYKDINERIILENLEGRFVSFSLNGFMALSLKKNNFIYLLLRKIYQLHTWKKKYLF